MLFSSVFVFGEIASEMKNENLRMELSCELRERVRVEL